VDLRAIRDKLEPDREAAIMAELEAAIMALDRLSRVLSEFPEENALRGHILAAQTLIHQVGAAILMTPEQEARLEAEVADLQAQFDGETAEHLAARRTRRH
jgi:hypothetical protein